MKTPALCLTLAMLLLSLAACQTKASDRLNPTPDFNRNIQASEIWEEFQSAANPTFVNDKYRQKWVKVKLDGVRGDGIDAAGGTRVLLRAPGTLQTLEFNFRYADDTEDDRLDEGKKPLLLCNVRGTNLSRTTLHFDHCRIL